MRKSSIILEDGALRFGALTFGFSDREYSYKRPSFLKIQGKLIIRGSGFHVFAQGTTLDIGEKAVCTIDGNFSASHNCRIRIMKSLQIGVNNMWSFDNVIMDNDAHHIYDSNMKFCNPNEGIIFGDNVWLGCRNIVLKGAIIPNNNIVSAGSIINKEYTEENCIISSFGRILKQRITWNRQLT